MDSKLQSLLTELRALRKDLKGEKAERVSKKAYRESAENLGSRWCNEFSNDLANRFGFSAELLDKYSQAAARLIKLSAPNNRRNSYLQQLDILIKPMRDELIIPLKSGQAGGAEPGLSAFVSFVSSLADQEESQYFTEATNCAAHGFLRAAVVMGWCAAIDRIHRRIEDLGFSKFNVASAQMATQKKGRYKRFNQTQNVTTLSELREVFDTTILWVIEGMGLIDSNQHTRLRSCFEMRCHSAHPGKAPITEYNVMSFFSDLQAIVLENDAFQIEDGS